MCHCAIVATVLVLIVAGIPLGALGQAATVPAGDAEAGFFYGGVVVDRQGRPIADVEVTATHRDPDDKSFGYIAVVKTNGQGGFTIERPIALSGAFPTNVSADTIRLEFRHKSYAYARLEDLHTLSREQAKHLSVTLRDGRVIKGAVVDVQGGPVPGASVEITFGAKYELRRATTSDANGRFEFRGLPALAGDINVLTTQPAQPMLTARRSINPAQTKVGEIMTKAIDLPPHTAVQELLGMKLIDVDAGIRDLFHLPRAGGVLVLDPGIDTERLKIGELQRGDQFWIVGDKPVKDIADFKSRLKAAARAAGAKNGIRVVYHFRRAEQAGTNTQYLELSEGDIAALSR